MDLILLVAPLVLMALLGVPHGALDGYVIQSVSRNNRDSIALFACYVLLAALNNPQMMAEWVMSFCNTFLIINR